MSSWHDLMIRVDLFWFTKIPGFERDFEDFFPEILVKIYDGRLSDGLDLDRLHHGDRVPGSCI